MSTSGDNVSKDFEILRKKSVEAAKRNADKFTHFCKEKIYYISKLNNQTLRTGYIPNSNGNFQLRIRFDDNRYGDHLTLTLFQFLTLLRDLRKFLYTDEENYLREHLNELIKFSMKEIDVPKVTIQVDATYSTPNLFELNLVRSKEERAYTIVLDRKTIQRLLEYEDDIINTVDSLEDGTSSYLFDCFTTKCVDLLHSENIEIESKKVYNAIKRMYKTSFQSEVFIKYWPLIFDGIVKKTESS